jgi:hypothetical protein
MNEEVRLQLFLANGRAELTYLATFAVSHHVLQQSPQFPLVKLYTFFVLLGVITTKFLCLMQANRLVLGVHSIRLSCTAARTAPHRKVKAGEEDVSQLQRLPTTLGLKCCNFSPLFLNETMTSLNNNFQQVLAKFTTRLTKQELNDFKFSSLDDVLATVETIQAEQGRRKEMMNLTRIQRFLEAMGQYGQVIEVFLNTSSILCFVWGPMKFCLQVRNFTAKNQRYSCS